MYKVGDKVKVQPQFCIPGVLTITELNVEGRYLRCDQWLLMPSEIILVEKRVNGFTKFVNRIES